jgi:hypothetical protein
MTARPLRATPAPWAALAAALGNHWRYVADPAASGYAHSGDYALLEGRSDELLLVTDPDGRAGYTRDERDALPPRVRVVGLFDRLNRRAGVTAVDHAYVDNPHVTQTLSKPAHVTAAADALLAQLAAYQPIATITCPNGGGAWGDGSRRLYPRIPATATPRSRLPRARHPASPSRSRPVTPVRP